MSSRVSSRLNPKPEAREPDFQAEDETPPVIEDTGPSDAELIEGHYLFDPDFITSQLQGTAVQKFEADPVGFYLSDLALDTAPHALFRPKFYLKEYEDVRSAGIAPLAHYIRSGAEERRQPNIMFKPDWYARYWTDSQLEGVTDLLQHYLENWQDLKANPHPYFDINWYLKNSSDVRRAGIEPLSHYLTSGGREGRPTYPLFDAAACKTLPGIDAGAPLIPQLENKGMDFSQPPHPVLHAPGLVSSRKSSYQPVRKTTPLDAWKKYNGPNVRRAMSLQSSARKIERRTKFSIIVPVYDPPLSILREAVHSVLNQTYQNFELILVDDASPNERIKDEIRALSALDNRIKKKFRKENGHISITTNEAAEMAKGEFLVFLDNDDKLAPNALTVLAAYVAEHGEADLIYSDDAKYDAAGQTMLGTKFKTGWSPELLYSYSYVSHLRVVRKSVYDQIGGTRLGFEGSQDHDMFLRLAEEDISVLHIPEILYERRALPGSTALGGNEKPYTFDAGIKAVQEALARKGLDVEVSRPDWAVRQNAGIYCPKMPDDGPSVTLIIPTKNNPKTLATLIRSLPLTSYKNYDVLIVDNESDDPNALKFMDTLPYKVLRVENKYGEFNFAHLNNVAAESVDSDYILFLNDDTEVTHPEWLSQMVGWMQLDGVGAVGARLLYPDGRIQHGGVSPELRFGYTMFRGLPGRDHGYLSYASVTRNCAAVTAACMLTHRETFLEIGGFDEENFGVAYNDIDYCLRLREAGNRIVYCGEAELVHHESATRSKQDKPSEIRAFREKYGRLKDPYLNPNMDRNSCRILVTPRVCPPPGNASKPRVLFFTHNLRPEGAPNSLFELVSGLVDQGVCEASVASPVDGPLKVHYEGRGIDVHIQPDLSRFNRATNRADYLNKADEISEALSLSDYDLVLCNTAETHGGIVAAGRAGIPSVWIIREGQAWNQYFHNLTSEVEALVLEAFALPYRVVFVSHASQNQWEGVNQNCNFTMIHNGLDTQRFIERVESIDRTGERRRHGFRNDDIVITCVGTVCARKGQHDLVLALTRLPADIRNRLQLVFVGARKSDYLDLLKRAVDGLPPDLAQRVTFVAENDRAGMYYRMSDIFFCGSRIESYPRVILEASAIGLPIITTPVSGIPEQVRDGVNAFCYEPGHVDALCHHIRSLVEDDELRQNAGASSVDVLKTLTNYEEMIERYGEIITQASFSSVPESRDYLTLQR